MRKWYFLALALAVGACTDSPTDHGTDNTPSVDIAGDSVALDLDTAPTKMVTAVVKNTSSKTIFTSSNASVASVDSLGLITAKSIGSTYVFATSGTARDSMKVAVRGSICFNNGTVANLLNTTASLTYGPGMGMVAGFSGSNASFVSQPVTLPLLGTGSVPERWTAEVAEANNVAYTTTWSSRSGNRGNAVKIWNVAGNTPILSDSLIINGAGTTSDVQISDDGKLVVVSVEGSSPNTRNGFAIYDRTNPAKPVLIRHFACPSTVPGVHTIKLGRVAGKHYAFLSIDPPAALVIVDITDPVNAKEIYQKSMGNPYLHDVFVRDGVLFTALWNTGMTIFDIGGAGKGGTPSVPVQLGTVKTANCGGGCVTGTASVHNIWWFNDPKTGSKQYAFIGEEGPASLFTNARGDIHVVDVSDFNNPREVAFYAADPLTSSTQQVAGTHNFDLDEPSGVLYAAYYNGGVRALDVRGDLSTCTAAQKSADGRCNLLLMGRELGVGLTASPSFIWGVKLDGNFLYASDMPNGLHKLNISALKR